MLKVLPIFAAFAYSKFCCIFFNEFYLKPTVLRGKPHPLFWIYCDSCWGFSPLKTICLGHRALFKYVSLDFRIKLPFGNHSPNTLKMKFLSYNKPAKVFFSRSWLWHGIAKTSAMQLENTVLNKKSARFPRSPPCSSVQDVKKKNVTRKRWLCSRKTRLFGGRRGNSMWGSSHLHTPWRGTMILDPF